MEKKQKIIVIGGGFAGVQFIKCKSIET